MRRLTLLHLTRSSPHIASASTRKGLSFSQFTHPPSIHPSCFYCCCHRVLSLLCYSFLAAWCRNSEPTVCLEPKYILQNKLGLNASRPGLIHQRLPTAALYKRTSNPSLSKGLSGHAQNYHCSESARDD